MFKRKITEEIYKWKNSTGKKKALVIKGMNAKSANTVLKNKEQYGVNQCIKLSANNVGQNGEKLTLPYYMVFLLG